jgi:hypothetical protein
MRIGKEQLGYLKSRWDFAVCTIPSYWTTFCKCLTHLKVHEKLEVD